MSKMKKLSTFGVLANLCFPALVFSQDIGTYPTLESLLADIRSNNGELQLSSIKSYASNPLYYGSDGVDIVRVALSSNSPGVAEYAITSLRRLMYVSDSSKSDTLSYLQTDSLLRDRLAALIETGDDRTSYTSAAASLSIYGDSVELEQASIRRYATMNHSVSRRDTIRLVLAYGLASKESLGFLLEVVTNEGPSDGVILAAKYLINEGHTTPELLDNVIQVIKTAEFFARPDLVAMIPNFGTNAVRYLVDIEVLLDEFEEQVLLDRFERSVVIYDESMTRSALQGSIRQIVVLASKSENADRT